MDEDKANQLVRDYQECFCSEAGKRVLADLKKDMHYQGIVPMDMASDQVKQLVGSWNVMTRIIVFLGTGLKVQ